MKVRGQRAKYFYYDDDFVVPQEIVDKVCKSFIVIGDETTKYIIPQPEKPIKIVTDDWRVTSDNDCNIIISRQLTEAERYEFLNAINNREIYLEDIRLVYEEVEE